MNWFKFASPKTFYAVADKSILWFAVLACVLTAAGLYWGFFQSPEVLNDQKQYYKIIYVHVASAWMAMWLYVMMTLWGLIGFIFNTRLSYMMASSIAPTGMIMAFLSLATGAIWGKTSWGTYWDWDPRLTSQLILFFMYIGYVSLQATIEDQRRADQASALLALMGLALVPVIYWSVNCPNPNECGSLHQESSTQRMDANILWGMLLTALGFWCYSFMSSMMRLRTIILRRESNTEWVKSMNEKSLGEPSV